MPHLNKCYLMGHLTRDPELKTTQTGKHFCKFSIAVSKKFKQGDGWKEKTTFINCVVWGATAEKYFSKYATKGSPLHIEGEIDVREYQTQNGEKRTATEIIVENVQVLAKQQRQGESQQQQHHEDPVITEEDGTPF